MSEHIAQDGRDVLLRLKVVPGAARTEFTGLLGDRLKLRICAPPEAGKANKAIIAFLATTLGVKRNQVTIESGQTSPEKLVRIADTAADAVRNELK